MPPSIEAPLRVLLVEDDADLREVLGEMLADEGFEVVSASSGAEALEAASQDIAVALLDLHLAGDSGVEVAERLRRMRPQLHVVVMSGQADAPVPVSMKRLVKPFELAALVSLLRPR